MQGAYRIWGAPQEIVESFVAAPGPAGWRYFGRGRHADTGEELFKVDYIVDAEWDLVRFRAIYGGGLDAVVVPVPGGLEVSVGQPGEERTEEIAGVSAVLVGLSVLAPGRGPPAPRLRPGRARCREAQAAP